MDARTVILAVAGMTLAGGLCSPAIAGDFGISFSYRGGGCYYGEPVYYVDDCVVYDYARPVYCAPRPPVVVYRAPTVCYRTYRPPVVYRDCARRYYSTRAYYTYRPPVVYRDCAQGYYSTRAYYRSSCYPRYCHSRGYYRGGDRHVAASFYYRR